MFVPHCGRHADVELRPTVPEGSFEPPEVRQDSERLTRAFLLSAAFALALWLVKIVETVAGLEMVQYGIHPGRISGLTGILAAPFIHGSPEHLVANTLPIVILGTALLYGYPKSARIVIPALFLGAGLGVWLFGRESYHVGASGLTFGLMFFVFTIGVLRWDRRAIGLALVVFFLYGGMVWGVFPIDPQVSYESHLSGGLTGVALALVLRRLDPPPPPKRYSWEQEAEAQPAWDDETEGPEELDDPGRPPTLH
jgi:membrane associated rhomboid family serine protease